MAEAFEGGCLCGAVRYRAGGDILRAGHCHCRMCQKASGAPMVSWAVAPIQSFSFTKGQPVEYRSSERSSRLFCGQCGSQLVIRDAGETKEIDINLATFDEPARVTPTYHIYTSSQQPWLHIADDLQRFPEDRAGR